MKRVLLFSLTAILFSCSSETTDSGSITDSTEVTDTLVVEQTDTVEALPEITPFDSIMDNPMDVFAFKKAKRGSLSGVGGGKQFHFQPEYEGKYMRFFGFGPPRGRSIREAEWMQGVQLIVYREGTDLRFYTDSNEIIIDFQSCFSDTDMKNLNIVGKSVSDVEAIFQGKAEIEGQFAAFISGHNVLVMHLIGQQIEWFRYIKLNAEPTSFEEIPKEVLSFENAI